MNAINIQAALGWIAQHNSWTLAVVFLVALAESLAVVGLAVPGAAAMVAAGAFIALGALEFWPTLLVATAGAITGDGISFWLGHRYRDRIRSVWPFRRHPDWLTRGEQFFHRHGGKSVLLGRFVGPVRPIIPVVAGMFGMQPVLFYAINVLSALVWAPAYLLPGMAFGASLSLASAVAARLALLLGLFVVLAVLGVWSIRWISRVLPPRAARLAERLTAWSNRHPRTQRIIGGVLDPAQPEFRALLTMGALLIGSGWLFLGVIEDVVTGDPLVRADQGLYELMQGLRTPWGDRAMVFVTELGDGMVISLIAVATLAWLIGRKAWRTAGYWVAAIGFGQFATFMIKLIVRRPRPVADLYDGLSAHAFPSGHAAMSTVTYGFLAVLIAGQLPRPRRWFVYAAATLLVCTIACSRLYLGAHWLSDVIGGLSLGLAWVCLLAIAYYRHPVSLSPVRGLPALVLSTLVLAGGWHVSSQYSGDLQRYATRQRLQHLDSAAWWQKDWKKLPAYRQDLEGEFEQPLNVQWAGSLTRLQRTLTGHGWQDADSLNIRTALRWLAPAASLEDLPLLPQVHDGTHAVLQMIYPLPETGTGPHQLVLRLWKSGVLLDPGGNALWVGYVAFQKRGRIALLTMPVGDGHYGEAQSILARTLKSTGVQLTQQKRGTSGAGTARTGDVLLVRNPS
jgi:undecaprenyl-diphosphatase